MDPQAALKALWKEARADRLLAGFMLVIYDLHKALGQAEADLAHLLYRHFQTWARSAARQAAEAYVKVRKGLDDADGDIDDVEAILAAVSITGWASIWKDLAPLLETISQKAAEKGFIQVGVSPDDEMTGATGNEAAAWARDRACELVGKVWRNGELVDNPKAELNILETTREKLRGTIADALQGGWDKEKLFDALQNNYAFSRSRSELIARTETANANYQGNRLAWKQSGVVERQKWITGSGNVCDDCQGMNGDEIGIDEDWPDGFPMHPNCNCTVVPLVEGQE
jgi:SPP1 gp7 family putative phage head morphogenesis protein